MPDQTRNLNSVTDFTGTLDNNDRIIMTDNKASLKALTTAILGKAIVEGYTGSSLAGSSQSVKSAIDSLNNKIISSTNATTIMEQILGFSTGTPCIVRFSGDAGTTFCGSTAQFTGVAFKADTSIVDIMCGSYSNSTLYMVRATKVSEGNYTVARKSVSLT